ncbi:MULTISPECIES: WXG100 family type VII secretion target [unclassified Nocardioides]|uniref:WXG100 family type VII secretion target n=1 Tax=unclassified Nocardioides TaxID=2615069 RepID=UPI0006F46E55|nr:MULTISPECIES: hypothetical protein [unclassified Nocardioides]KQY57082.1 hypothetical protein ASD30_12535 [Nocardioides sp. Root140]KRF11722.1 hypothetical protein ASH02_17180 [Nocardioides sp. Soil796]
MSINLVVDGSPASCRQAAHDLRELGGRVTAASDMLARAMGTAAGCWTGESSDAFTDFVKERIHRADGVADEINLFAGALEGFGAGLADVKAEMKRARAIAVAADLPVSTSLPEVGEVALKPGQEGALDHAVGVATRAHEHEHRLHEALLLALGQVNTLVWQEFDYSTLGKAASGGSGSKLGDLIPDLPDLSKVPVPVGPISQPTIGLLQGGFTVGKEVLTRTFDAGMNELERRYADGSLERDIRTLYRYHGEIVGIGAGLYFCRAAKDRLAYARCVKATQDAGKVYGKAEGDFLFWAAERAAR